MLFTVAYLTQVLNVKLFKNWLKLKAIEFRIITKIMICHSLLSFRFTY